MHLKASQKLDRIGINYRLIKLADRAISTEDVKRYSEDDLEPREICKTIILRSEEGEHYAVLLQGEDRIDLDRAKEFLNVEVELASREDVRDITGLEFGAICPILLEMPILVDERVLEHEKINFGSGDHHYGIELYTRDLDRAITYTKMDIADTP